MAPKRHKWVYRLLRKIWLAGVNMLLKVNQTKSNSPNPSESVGVKLTVHMNQNEDFRSPNNILII